MDTSNEIYCEKCGKTIFRGGLWVKETGKYQPGVCSGPCERELCGNCGNWDDEGCCHDCSKPDCCDECPKEKCEKRFGVCDNPCATCPGDIKCYTESTDVRDDCEAFRKFKKQLPRYKDEIKTGWWKVSFELTLGGNKNVRFWDLSETSQKHILKCIKDGCNQGQLVEEIDEQEEEGA